MGLLDATPPPYDPLDWKRRPFSERARMVCQAWALQGHGTPLVVYAAYALKVVLYVTGWLVSCGFSAELGNVDSLDSWWLRPEAFQRAILWSLLFEVLGLGCGSGPLTGRFRPPIGGALYFLNPGTTKSATFPGVRWLGSDTRGWLDVGLYFALLLALGRALTAPHLTSELLLPVVVLVPLLALFDKTVFLAARPEHYWSTALVFVFAVDWVPGAKIVQAALWFWAGVSKLNRHFPSVVCVMHSNSPLTRCRWLRKSMYLNYPNDLRPSKLAVALASFGTALELGVPMVLLLGDGGLLSIVGIVLMLALHGFIASSVPVGVPIEWNVMVVYGGVFLFGEHAGTSVFALQPLWLYLPLLTATVILPLIGNLKPGWISFLLAMRYYAGNWATSIWFFEGQSYRKLDALKKTSPWFSEQLDGIYDEAQYVASFGKLIAFRAMHVHGRAFMGLVNRALDDPDRYEWVDGELVAGLVVGWNFGEGQLHSERLLQAVQAQCGFEPGELRCIFIQPQPLLNPRLAYRIHDASAGELERGTIRVDDLVDRQPWEIECPPIMTQSSLARVQTDSLPP